ncbi:VOC family protein [Candidatus Poriferisodalis sp.]|uniref:VOC family protein n=1 Tax=Candidatus Poriferisodalis sp. TaxID=3101277 RepID=UPI003B51D1D6
MAQVQGLDHIVLNVADAQRSLCWYRDRLGLAPVRYDEWTAGEAPFPSVRIDEGTIIDLVETARSGENLGHFALWVTGDAEEIAAHPDVEVVRRSPRVYGARGWGSAVYVRDPDGNEVELRSYGLPGPLDGS